MPALPLVDDAQDSRARSRTVAWVVAICTIALIFDGYDLVVYGTIVPILLADPSQLGAISPELAGQLGSYALVGVLIGALGAGALSDIIGRRKLMLVNIAWFSVGMALTALVGNAAMFGAMRLFTGIGVGALVATAGAIVAEFAPAGRRHVYNAIVYCGVPAGGVMASLFALAIRDSLGWHALFLVGATPILFLLPLAWAKLPESPLWLQSRGRTQEAVAASRATGVPLVEHAQAGVTARPTTERAGFAALVSRQYFVPTVFLGLMSFSGLLLTYGLNTWLPHIMGQHGFGKSYSLVFLLVLNLGAIVGALTASRFAEKVGPQRVIAATFVMAAAALVLLPFGLPVAALLALVAVAGIGTIGTQVLVYGFVSNFYESRARGAGVAWCAGFGRLGGIVGPLVGGVLIGAGISIDRAFQLFAVAALVGAVVTALPRAAKPAEQAVVVDPSGSEPTGRVDAPAGVRA
ncbi:MFS transporter [Agilicoccus flavus]|uniref:MFS transporter n=1 Tax=Agilicoccus flavus TaxID=2775968 RepID=UPI001CF700CD|nr:aromatic acid/H+ symport family MFS transporter [Agilicoccus flavus]